RHISGINISILNLGHCAGRNGCGTGYRKLICTRLTKIYGNSKLSRDYTPAIVFALVVLRATYRDGLFRESRSHRVLDGGDEILERKGLGQKYEALALREILLERFLGVARDKDHL